MRKQLVISKIRSILKIELGAPAVVPASDTASVLPVYTWSNYPKTKNEKMRVLLFSKFIKCT